VKIKARIELLPTSKGGRSDPLIGSFRPRHCFDQNGFVIGEIEQPEGASLRPGEASDLTVNFFPDGLPKLGPGLRWAFYDGPHLIGYGTVLAVPGEASS